MTVAELLKELEHCPDDAKVVIRLNGKHVEVDGAAWYPCRKSPYSGITVEPPLAVIDTFST